MNELFICLLALFCYCAGVTHRDEHPRQARKACVAALLVIMLAVSCWYLASGSFDLHHA